MSVAVRVIPCLDVSEGRVVKGVNFVDLVDAGDPGRTGPPVRRGGRRRADVPGHHRHQRQPAQRLRDDPAHRRAGVHPADRRRRGPHHRRHRRAAARRRGQGVGQLGRRGPAGVPRPRRPTGSGRSAWSSRSTPAGSAASTAADLPVRVRGHHPRRAAGHRHRRGDWAERAEDAGAGEILLTSMDADGTKDGFDTDMLAADPGGGRGAADRLRRGRRARPLPGGHRGRRGRGAGGLGVPFRRSCGSTR